MRRHGASPAAVEAALLAENRTHCQPPLSDLEVERIAHSVARYAAAENDSVIYAVTVEELMAMKIPDRPCVVAPWLREKNLAMLHAWRGVGKTWFMLALALAAATGTEFLGWTLPAPRQVLLVDGEMPIKDLRERLRLLMPSGAFTDGLLKILAADMFATGLPHLDSERGQAIIADILEPGALLIFDNYSSLFRCGDENDAASWVAAQEWLLSLRRQGYTVLLAHHEGKGGAQRGTSKREDVLDVVIRLARPEGYQPREGARFEVHFEKARGLVGADVDPFEAQLEAAGDGSTRWRRSPIRGGSYERVVELRRLGNPQSDIARVLNLDKSTVSRHVKRARESGDLHGREGAGDP